MSFAFSMYARTVTGNLTSTLFVTNAWPQIIAWIPTVDWRNSCINISAPEHVHANQRVSEHSLYGSLPVCVGWITVFA